MLQRYKLYKLPSIINGLHWRSKYFLCTCLLGQHSNHSCSLSLSISKIAKWCKYISFWNVLPTIFV